MAGARKAALEPGRAKIPADLQVAFLVERYGAQAILGAKPSLLELLMLAQLSNVYNVFKKVAAHRLKDLTAGEKKLMMDVMTIAAELKESATA